MAEPTELETLEARIDAAEEMILGILEILRDSDPKLRPVILKKLDEIAESFHDMNKPAQVGFTEIILESFRHS